MSTQNSDINARRFPLWVIVLISALLIISLSSASVFVYKQSSKNNPDFKAKQSGLETRKQLILLQPDVIDINWLRTLNPLVKNVQGRLIWSSDMQQGVMEFNQLPSLAKNQRYRLWIYDLVGDITKPISAIVFKHSGNASDNYLISFDTEESITSPFKFELVLEEDGKENGLPLLLAQP